MNEAPRPTVLCVDDEPNVLSGLRLVLRRRYRVLTAESGEAGLEVLEAHPEVAVVVSDMRMPGMNGAEFLARARELRPLVTRILLTGYAEVDAAIDAINRGQVFRFLVKPAEPPKLLGAVRAAVELHDAFTAERELLDRTLRGAVKVLAELFSLAEPEASGRASRVQQHVRAIAEALGQELTWDLEVAAALYHIGAVTLDPDTRRRHYAGEELSGAERIQVERIPEVAADLLGAIPRLDGVRAILKTAASARDLGGPPPSQEHVRALRRQASMLRVANDYESLRAAGRNPKEAMAELRRRGARYDGEVLAAFLRLIEAGRLQGEIAEVPVDRLQAGMVLAEDLRTATGILLVREGYEVGEGLVRRLANLRAKLEKPTVRVYARRAAAA